MKLLLNCFFSTFGLSVFSLFFAPTVYGQSIDFESGLGKWENTGAFNWYINIGKTGSNGTGPSKAASGNYYLYFETSTGFARNQGDSAYLTGPSFSAGAETLEFKYHMHGENTGMLMVEVNKTTIWTISGQQHLNSEDQWTQVVLPLAQFGSGGVIRFSAHSSGTGYKGDIAIDDIKIVGAQDVLNLQRRVIYVHPDLLGSPAAESDEDGNVIK